MEDARLFGPSGQPVTPAAMSDARVQPPEMAAKRVERRLQGIYLLMPKKMYDQLSTAHEQLLRIGRAPESFDDWLKVLIHAGAEIVIPTEHAEFEAGMQATLQALSTDAEARGDQAVLDALKTANDMDADDDARQAAWTVLGQAEKDRRARLQQPKEQAPLDEVNPLAGTGLTADGHTPDERPERDVVEDVVADANAAEEQERAGAALVEQALADTPEPGDPF